VPARPRIRHFLLVALLATAAVLVLLPGRRMRDDPGAVLAALRASAGPLLPGLAASGAEGSTPPARYTRDTLYELVNGAAEAYLARGFERCVASVYAFAGGVEVAAEVHRFSDAGGARAQLEAERPASALPMEGLAAVGDDAVVLAVRDRDLLKLTALTPDARGREALRRVVTAWSREKP
jgi:hypothetical protein